MPLPLDLPNWGASFGEFKPAKPLGFDELYQSLLAQQKGQYENQIKGAEAQFAPQRYQGQAEGLQNQARYSGAQADFYPELVRSQIQNYQAQAAAHNAKAGGAFSSGLLGTEEGRKSALRLYEKGQEAAIGFSNSNSKAKSLLERIRQNPDLFKEAVGPYSGLTQNKFNPFADKDAQGLRAEIETSMAQFAQQATKEQAGPVSDKDLIFVNKIVGSAANTPAQIIGKLKAVETFSKYAQEKAGVYLDLINQGVPPHIALNQTHQMLEGRLKELEADFDRSYGGIPSGNASPRASSGRLKFESNPLE